jgi:hypothetical protein
MNIFVGSTPQARSGERGTARLKFIIVLVVVAVVAYMGFQYVPVAYQSYRYKDYMQQSVDKATALGQGSEWVKSQLEASAKDYGVPGDAKIMPVVQNGRMEVTVKFTRPVNLLPGFTYNYAFDHTAKSTELFGTK